MGKKPVILEVKAPKDLPAERSNEIVINKFLKLCTKEGVNQLIYEKSAYTKRFIKKSVVDRQKRLLYKRNAQKANSKNNSADNL